VVIIIGAIYFTYVPQLKNAFKADASKIR